MGHSSSGLVVIGAGLTGLAAARAATGGAVVLEQEDRSGGCLRSDVVGPYIIDRTGHLFHMRSRRVMEMVDPDGAIDWLRHERDARVMLRGRLQPYPIQYNLFGLPPDVIAECIAGARAARPVSGRGRPFDQWARANFGDGLWKLFFEPYNRKLWCHDLHVMTADWTGRFVPPPDVERMAAGATVERVRDASGYNASFDYPTRGGSQAICDAMTHGLGDVRHRSRVVRVLWEERRVVLDDGSSVPYEVLVSTAPMDALVDMMYPSADEVGEARRRLLHTSIGYVAMAGPGRAPEWHWTYVVDPGLSAFRVGNLGSYGRGLAPDGEVLLCVEQSFAGHVASQVADDVLIEGAARVLARAELGLDPGTLRAVHVGRLDPAYVVFTPERGKAVRLIRHWLLERGIVSTGRYGAWTYGAAGDAVMQGAAAARWAERARRG